jgi:hypothetical protein
MFCITGLGETPNTLSGLLTNSDAMLTVENFNPRMLKNHLTDKPDT